jgi:hypothetical protein
VVSWKDALLDLFGFEPPAAEPQPKPSLDPAAKPRASTKAAGASAPAAGGASTRPRPARQPATSPPPQPSDASKAPRAGRRSEAEVLAVVRAAGGPFRRVVFTSNRRVMASVAERGTALRLNEAFGAAPDAVLHALSALFSARERRKRESAREAVRHFIQHIPVTAAPIARRRRHVHPGDQPHLERLRAELDRVNALHFGGSLPAVPLYLSGQMRRRNGHFSSHPPEIVISRRLCTHGEPGEAEHTLRHEIVHLWQHATGRPVDHGLDFRRMARKLDVHPRATRPVRWRTG